MVRYYAFLKKLFPQTTYPLSFIKINLFFLFIFCLFSFLVAGCGKKEKKEESEKQVSGQKIIREGKPSFDDKKVSILTKDHPPEIIEIGFLPAHPVTGDTLEAKVIARDKDKDKIRYFFEWKINNEVIQASEDCVLHQPIKADDRIVVAVAPSDSTETGHTVKNMVIVGNAPPEIALQDQRLESDIYYATVSGKDPEGDRLTFSLKEAPEGMKIDENGLISWTINKDISGEFPVVVIVKDTYGAQTLLSYIIKIKRAKR